MLSSIEMGLCSCAPDIGPPRCEYGTVIYHNRQNNTTRYGPIFSALAQQADRLNSDFDCRESRPVAFRASAAASVLRASVAACATSWPNLGEDAHTLCAPA